MRADFRALVLLTVVTLLLGAAGCSSSATSPTSPSVPSRGAMIQGTVQTGAAASRAELSAFSTAGGIKVSVVGTSLSTTTDASGRFVLSGVPTGNVVVRFESPGVDARLEISGLADGQTITITVQVQGTRAVLVQGEAEFTGTIQSITPPNMLVVSGQRVVVNAATEIKRGDAKVPFSDLKVGDAVKVEGAFQGDGTVLAREIKAGGQGQGAEIEFTGMIQSITPPTLQVSGRTVVTDARTQFSGQGRTHSLADFHVGDTVRIRGVLQADGGVLARDINRREEARGEEIDFKGGIQSITPPTLMVSGRNVVTNGGTEIRLKDRRGSLTDLKVGQRVEVKGTVQPDGSVLANRIKVEDDDD